MSQEDPAPALVLSSDRRIAAVYSPDGRKATFESSSDTGFTDEQLTTMLADVARPNGMVPGQRNRVRRYRFGPVQVFLHVNTGPPTWWLPRVQVSRTKDSPGVTVMTGWLHCLVAATVQMVARRSARSCEPIVTAR